MVADTVIYVEPITPIILANAPQEQEPANASPLMASFEIAYQVVKRNEGGYQNFANDPGNYNSRGQQVGTNWGINAKVYEDWIGRPPSVADMRAMTAATAKRIYREKYWDNIKGDQIQNQQIATLLFDGHVNHGFWGIRMMQQVLGVTDDGRVGPITLAAINQANPSSLFELYKERRIRFYHHYANNTRPDMKDTWLQPWLNRMAGFVYQDVGGSSGQAYASNSTDGLPIGILAAVTALYFLG